MQKMNWLRFRHSHINIEQNTCVVVVVVVHVFTSSVLCLVQNVLLTTMITSKTFLGRKNSQTEANRKEVLAHKSSYQTFTGNHEQMQVTSQGITFEIHTAHRLIAPSCERI